ncbi:hypothetical protein CKF54_02005, partial [Psittacicella hinzii]
MNAIYKLKFNRRTLSLDAVSELATNAITASTTHKDKEQPSALSFRRLCILLNSFLLPSSALVLAPNALALERSGMEVVNGFVNVVTNGAVTSITNSPNAIINWQKFNIQSNEIVKFLQESSSSAVLNRVLGGELSQILGTLQSNGKVFIVNPAGIVFGDSAVVDVSSLVASTLDLSDQDFLSGNYVFDQDKDQAIASVINQGMIKVADDGTLALVGGKVLNTGVLEAKNGTIYLLAGQSITIQDLDNPLISYKVTADNKAVNLGEIVSKRAVLLANKVAHGATDEYQSFADLVGNVHSARKASITASGEVVLYGASEAELMQDTSMNDAQLAANYTCQSGLVLVNSTICASNPVGVAGNVSLLGDAVILENHALINASGKQGGNVYIGGDKHGKGDSKLADFMFMDTQAVVNVSGTEENAGTTIAWGNYAVYDGTFLATSIHGDGGFVETSAENIRLKKNLKVSTTSVYGKVGNWLIDPLNLLIINSTADVVKALAENNYARSSRQYVNQPYINVRYYGPEVEPDDRADYIVAPELAGFLNDNNVTIEVQNNLTFYNVTNFNSPEGPKTLTLKAQNFSFINSNFTTKTRISIIRLDNSRPGVNLNLTNSTLNVTSFAVNSAVAVNALNSKINATEYIDFNVGGKANFTNSSLNAVGKIDFVLQGRDFTTTLDLNRNSAFVAGTNLNIRVSNGTNINRSTLRGSTIDIKGTLANTPITLTNNSVVQGSSSNSYLNISNTSTGLYPAVTLNGVTFRDLGSINVTAGLFNATNARTNNNVTGNISFDIYLEPMSTFTSSCFSSLSSNVSIIKRKGNLVVNTTNLSANRNITIGVVESSFNATNSNFSANQNLRVLSRTALYLSGSQSKANSTVIQGTTENTNISLVNSSFTGTTAATSTISIGGTTRSILTLSNVSFKDLKDISTNSASFNSTQVSTQNVRGNITVSVTGASTSHINTSNFTTTGGNVTFGRSSGDFSGTGSTFRAQQVLCFTSSAGGLSFTNSNFTSVANNVLLYGSTNVRLTGSKVDANNMAQLRASSIDVSNTNINATSGEVSIGNASTANVNFSNSQIRANNSNATVSGYQLINVINTSFYTKLDLNLSTAASSGRNNGRIVINNQNGAKFTVERNLNITTNNLALNNSTLEVTGNIGLQEQTTNGGNFTANNTSAKAVNINVTFNRSNLVNTRLYATNNLLFNSANSATIDSNSNLTASKDLTLRVGTLVLDGRSLLNATTTQVVGTTGAVITNGSTINSTSATNLTANDLTVNNAKVDSAGTTTLTGRFIDVNGSAAFVTAKGNTFINSSATVNVTNNALVAGQNVNLSAGTDLTIVGGTVTGNARTDLYAKNKLCATNAQICSTNTLVNIYAENEATLTNSNVNAKANANVNSKQITAQGTNFSGNNIVFRGTSAVASDNISLNNSNLAAVNNLRFVAYNVTTNNSNLTAAEIVITNANNVSLNNSLLNATTRDVTINASKQLDVTNSEVKSAQANVNLNVGNATLTSSNLTAQKELNIKASGEVNSTNNSNLTSAAGNVTISATSGVSLESGSSAKAKNTVTVYSERGAIDVSGANLTAEQKDVNLTAHTSINLTNKAYVKGNTFVNLTASKILANNSNATGQNLYFKGQLDALNSQLNATQNMVLDGNNDLIIARSSILTAGNNLTATGKQLNFNNSTVDAKNFADFTANEFIEFRDANLTAKNLNASAGTLIRSFNSNFTANENLNFSASQFIRLNDGMVKANKDATFKANRVIGERTSITATQGNASFNANVETSLNSSNVSAGSIKATGTTVNVSNSNLTATADEISLGNADTNIVNVKDAKLRATSKAKGDVNLRGNTNVNVSNSTVNAGRDINLAAPTGTVNISNSSSVTAERSINITSADAELLNALVNATSTVGIEVTNNLNTKDSEVKSQSVSVKAGTANLVNTNVNSTQKDLNVDVTNSLTLNNSTLKADKATENVKN